MLAPPLSLFEPQPRPVAANFPHTIRGLIVDLDAAQGITLNGADVSAWADQSGAANHVGQATAALQPVFTASNPRFKGAPSVDFHKAPGEYLFGSSLPICTALSGSDKPFTVFLVASRTTKISADEYAWTLGNSAQAGQSYFSGGWRYQSSNSQRVNSDVRDDAGTAATNSTGQNEYSDYGPQVLAWSMSGTVARTFVVSGGGNPHYDAAKDATASGGDYSAQGAITFNRFAVGAQLRSTAGRPCEMEVARVLVYDRELADSERIAVAVHLWKRYVMRRIAAPTDLPGCIGWWDAAQLAGDLGAGVSTLEDLVGSLDFSASGFGAPIIAAHENGAKTLLFRGSGTGDAMDTAAAADGNRLHNGSDLTLGVVYRVEEADAIVQPIVDTNGNSATARGFSLVHDGASGAHSLQVKIGTGAANVLNHDSQDGGSRPGAWHLLLLTRQGTKPASEEHYHITLDGETYVAANQANTPDAGDAAGPITLGKLVGAATYAKMQLAEMFLYDRPLGRPGELARLGDYAARKWWTSHAVPAAGNGLANVLSDATSHRGFSGLLYTQDRDWLHTFRRGATHGSSAGVACLQRSGEALEFTQERVIFDDSANFDWRGTNFLGQISTGRIFLGMKLSQPDSTLLPYTAGVLYSDNGGSTWQGPIFLSQASDAWFQAIGSGVLTYDEGVNSIVELADGTLLAHFMAQVSGAVFPHIVQCKSTDGGATWTEPVVLYYGRQPGLGDFPVDERIQEPVVLRFDDGELLMAIRADTPNEKIYFVGDVTGTGDAWLPAQPTTSDRVDGWGNPRLARDPNSRDGVFLFHRLNTSPHLAVYRYSADRGKQGTWSAARPVTNLQATTTIAGYGGMVYSYPAIGPGGHLWLAFGLEQSNDADCFVRRWANKLP